MSADIRQAFDAYAHLVRDVPDFPKPGIVFKDITPLLADAQGFAAVVEGMCAPWRDAALQAIAGVESRGFIFAAAMARHLGAGFVPIRKAGKLPAATHRIEYALEYGSDCLEIHRDAVRPGTRVLLVDDVLATGGTLCAARELLQATGAELCGAGVLVELEFLHGRARWGESRLEALLRY